MFRNVYAAIKHFLASPQGEHTQRVLEKHFGSTLEVLSLPIHPVTMKPPTRLSWMANG